MKLHLGCGQNYIQGYLNIDSDIDSKADIFDDVVVLGSIIGDVEEIYACNILEHLGRYRYKQALQRWYDILDKGGKLKLSVPDFASVCEYYVSTKDLKSLYPALYAGQDSDWNFHYWCWDYDTLKRELEEIGFTDIKRWTDHPIRDWSINYVPYHDSDGNELPDDEWKNGTFIALNIEGIK